MTRETSNEAALRGMMSPIIREAAAMRRTRPFALLLIPFLVLIGTSARADDAAYCAAMGNLAWRYIAASAIDGTSKPDLETKAAIEECDKGNYAAGIAVLERKLRDNHITLPKRS